MYGFFKLYCIWKIRHNFHEVYIKGDFRDKNLPVLLVSNHVSWWDGFWAMYLNLKFLKRRFYFMMLENQLRNFMFFNKTGGYSIKKGSKSIIETLNYTIRLLSDNKNMVLLFPQGRIQSIYNSTFRFEKGLEYLLNKITRKVHLIFLVCLIDYFSHSRPCLFLYFKEYLENDCSSPNIEKEYNMFYAQCIAENSAITTL